MDLHLDCRGPGVSLGPPDGCAIAAACSWALGHGASSMSPSRISRVQALARIARFVGLFAASASTVWYSEGRTPPGCERLRGTRGAGCRQTRCGTDHAWRCGMIARISTTAATIARSRPSSPTTAQQMHLTARPVLAPITRASSTRWTQGLRAIVRAQEETQVNAWRQDCFGSTPPPDAAKLGHASARCCPPAPGAYDRTRVVLARWADTG